MNAPTALPAPASHPERLLVPAAIGAAVAIALGIYGREHDPAFDTLPTDLFFSGTLNLKVWFATAAVAIAIWQLYLGGVMYSHLPWLAGTAPGWVGTVHRASGTLALLLTLPVAYHCLYSLGFQDDPAPDFQVLGDNRVLFHSILGCLWFGGFAAKVTIVEMKGLPGWSLPLMGAVLFAILAAIWYTSAYWFFQEVGFPEF